LSPDFKFLSVALCGLSAVLAGCSVGETSTEGEAVAVESTLTIDQRVARYTAIRTAAEARGIHAAYLLAGIANTETGLAQCWSEAQWACQGPSSAECGGGPVIAGSSDGPCGNQQGGLGMFQFDAGTYAQTINRYGPGILTVDGQIGAAIDYVVNMVKVSEYTTNAETDAKARAWINNFDADNATLRDQWIKTVLRYYNGCQPGWNCWNPRYRTYSDGMWTAIDEPGGLEFWGSAEAEGGFVPGAPPAPPGGGAAPPAPPADSDVAPGGGDAPASPDAPDAPAAASGTRCGDSPPVVGAIEAKYLQMGGCGSLLGAPLSEETAAADGIGRYSEFEHGAIYWTPSLGAHSVNGLIYEKWLSLGAETGVLGYPFRDETGVPDRSGRYSVFERGSIYWKPNLGAFEVHGKIRDKWAEAGWESGELGFPTSDEYVVPEGRRNDFEGGTITWHASNGQSTIALSGAGSRVLDIDFQIQQTGYWCGPASTHHALSARMAAPSQQQLANELGTTQRGTDWIGQITTVLNNHLDGSPYVTTELPNDPPTPAQRDRLWVDIVTSIDNGFPVVANIVAPAGNHPPGYPNYTVYHYFTVIGYDAENAEVFIADSANFSGQTLYWLSFGQLATLIPPKGYSAYRP
jgi:hypothetical protein